LCDFVDEWQLKLVFHTTAIMIVVNCRDVTVTNSNTTQHKVTALNDLWTVCWQWWAKVNQIV